MKNQIKSILGILIFIVFILGTYRTYQFLSKEYKPDTQLPVTQETPNPSAATSAPPDAIASQDPSSASATEEPSVTSAPDFTVYNAEGKEVHLSDFAGKPIVLNFWASWCPPCKSEMPHFNEVYNQLKEKDIVFLMVDLTDGSRETVDSATQYVSDQGYSFPIYFDKDLNAAYAYEVNSIPATYFIDKNGIVVTNELGAMDKETLQKGIDLILK